MARKTAPAKKAKPKAPKPRPRSKAQPKEPAEHWNLGYIRNQLVGQRLTGANLCDQTNGLRLEFENGLAILILWEAADSLRWQVAL